MRYKPTRQERRKLFPKRVRPSVVVEWVYLMRAMRVSPNPSILEFMRISKKHNTHTIAVELEYVMGSKEYCLADLSKPVEDPVEQCVNELKRDSYDSLFDISLLEVKGAVTLILDPLRSSEENAEEFEAFTKEYVEFVRQHAASGKVIDPGWLELFITKLLTHIPDSSTLARSLNSLHPTLLFTRDPNGWAIKCNGGNILALDAALKPLLDYINGFIFLCKHRAVHSKEAFSFTWLSERLLPAVLYFVSDYPASRLPWVIAPSVQAAQYNKQISECQIKFIVAHELGHILLDHLSGSTSASALSTVTGERLPREAVVSNMNELQELEADQFAVNFCKSSVVNRVLLEDGGDLSEIPLSRMAIELLFLILGLIEAAAAVLLRQDDAQVVTRSHPRAADRLAAIRAFHPMDVLNDRKTLSFAESLFAQWLSLLEKQGADLKGASEWLERRGKARKADHQGAEHES